MGVKIIVILSKPFFSKRRTMKRNKNSPIFQQYVSFLAFLYKIIKIRFWISFRFLGYQGFVSRYCQSCSPEAIFQSFRFSCAQSSKGCFFSVRYSDHVNNIYSFWPNVWDVTFHFLL